jgi:uncharacterized protein (DUF1499 family)
MIDLRNVRLSRIPNQRLVAPRDYCAFATPHAVAPTYDVRAEVLAKAFDAVAMAQPRTVRKDRSGDRRRAEYEQRTLLGFPDAVTVEFIALDGRRSTLALYSRSLYGLGDWGVNRRRVDRWLAALADRLAAAPVRKPRARRAPA